MKNRAVLRVAVPTVLAVGLLAAPLAQLSAGGTTAMHQPKPAPKPPALGTIFAADPNPGHGIYSFAPKSSGNIAPKTHITGNKTGYYEPIAVATEKDGSIWEGGIRGPIVKFAPRATGNVKPLQSIAGAKTGIFEPTGIAVAANGSIWVANEAGSTDVASLLHFAADATGNVKPLQAISGTTSGLQIPSAVALTPDGKNIWEVDNGALREFSTKDNGDIAPENVISGNNTKLNFADPGIYAAPDGSLWVSEINGLLHFAPDATGNAVPTEVTGAATGLDSSSQISPDAQGNLWVGSRNNGSVVEIPSTAVGNTPYIRDISGAKTDLTVPWGAAVYGYRPSQVTKIAGSVRHLKTKVTWQQPKHNGGGIVYYVVQRRLSGGAWETIYGGKSLSFTDSKTIAGTKRQYRVAAVNGFGYGGYSATKIIHASKSG